MSARLALASAVAFGAALLTPAVEAAEVVVVNLDGPGEGFNNLLAVPPVTGNPATSRGGQALNAFQAAANWWGMHIGSSVTIVVEAQMDPLTCDPSSGLLGLAGPNAVTANFANAPESNTWYPIALADSLAQTDIQGAVDIGAVFNSSVDDPTGCLAGVVWWYGIGASAPPGTVSFFDTVRHELAHGLGFLTVVDLATGAEAEAQPGVPLPDIYETHLEDHSLGLTWPDLSDVERAASAVDGDDLHWVGHCVTTECGRLRTGSVAGGHVQMYAPNPLKPGSSVTHWDTVLSPDELMEPTATLVNRTEMTMGLFEDLGWGRIVVAVRSAGDVNGNGSEDYAVLVKDFEDARNAIFVRDGADGSRINTIFINPAFSAIDMEPVAHFDDAAANELAVLMYNPVTTVVQIQIRDALTGTVLTNIYTSRMFFPVELEVVPDIDGGGVEEVVILARHRVTGVVRMTPRDASTGAVINHVYNAASFQPLDLEVMANYGGGPAAELVLLSASCADGTVRMDVKDAGTDAPLSRIVLPAGFVPIDMETVPHFTGGPAGEIAVLSLNPNDGSANLRVREGATGNLILNATYFSSQWDAVDLEPVPDFGGTSAFELAVLGYRRSTGQVLVRTKDASSGADLSELDFGTTYDPRGLGVYPDVDGNQAPEIVNFGVKLLDSDRRAVAKDASTGVTRSSVSF